MKITLERIENGWIIVAENEVIPDLVRYRARFFSASAEEGVRRAVQREAQADRTRYDYDPFYLCRHGMVP